MSTTPEQSAETEARAREALARLRAEGTAGTFLTEPVNAETAHRLQAESEDSDDHLVLLFPTVESLDGGSAQDPELALTAMRTLRESIHRAILRGIAADEANGRADSPIFRGTAIAIEQSLRQAYGSIEEGRLLARLLTQFSIDAVLEALDAEEASRKIPASAIAQQSMALAAMRALRGMLGTIDLDERLAEADEYVEVVLGFLEHAYEIPPMRTVRPQDIVPEPGSEAAAADERRRVVAVLEEAVGQTGVGIEGLADDIMAALGEGD